MQLRSIGPLATLCLPIFSFGQGAGNELFDTDQVIDIQLTFSQPGFWDSLTTYYDEGLERNLLGSIVLTDSMGTYSYDSVGVRLKGNSSYGVPGVKKSMKIDFNEYVSAQKYHGLKKLTLNNGFNDPTFLREKIFFDYCLDQGVLAPRSVFGDLHINGTLWGFYGVVEQVDKTFLDRWVDDQDGNLFKAGDQFGGGGGTTAADLGYHGAAQSNYTARYELKTNEDVDDWSDLIALVDLLNNSSDADLAAQLPAQWVWNPMLRSLALDNLFSNLDSYINSARNFYIYHDSSTFQWNWIKWDANEAFGRYGGMGVGNLLNLAPNYVAPSRPLMTRIMAIAPFYNDYITEYCAAFDDFTNAHLDPHIDSLVALIQSHVYADPNKQYTNAQFDANISGNITVTGGGGGGTQTVFGLKSFISSRRSYLTGALDCTTIGVQEIPFRDAVHIHPNPTSGIVSIVVPVGSSVTSASLLDALGRELHVTLVAGTIDLSGQPPGAYTLRLLHDGLVTNLRVVKE